MHSIAARQESECSTHQRLQLNQSRKKHLHKYAFVFRAHGRTTSKLPQYVRRGTWLATIGSLHLRSEEHTSELQSHA